MRILKLARYNQAIERFRKAFYMIREELALYTCASLILLYLTAVGIYYLEHPAQPEVYRSIFDSLWWSIATFTTVGYGDIYPVTTMGRIFTFFMLIIGLGVVAVPTGLFASALAKVRFLD